MMDIIIVGAGPVGLTAGVELVRQGANVLIIDKRNAASTLSRAVGINPKSLKLLEPSGVTARLLEKGIVLKNARFYQGNKLLTELPLGCVEPVQYGFNFMLGLPQDETERILCDRFRELGGKLYYNEALVHLTQDDKKVQAHLASGELIEADYLIGADGIHSSTRSLLNLKLTRRQLEGLWSIADAEVESQALNEGLSLYMLANGEVAIIVPIGKDRYRFVSNTENVLESLPFKPEIKALKREGQFTITLSQVERYQKGRVFLAGDAAHSHSPAGGRGMNLGIADACELARRLMDGSHHDYSASRHLEGKKVIQGSEFLRKSVSAKNPVKRALFFSAFKLIHHLPFLQRRLANKLLYG
jgi:2-polyprenyl-6-methoxyphenol hydroxylase-like FAD-dependent oxidoreductase